MREVAIVADSPVTLLPEFIVEHDISIVPLHVIDDGKDYLDTEMDMDWLYSRLSNKANLPSTACPSPGQYLQAFQECSQKAANIICISMTAAFSKSYQSAFDAVALARTQLPGTRIELFDCRTAEAGEMMLVIELARAVKEGSSFDDIVTLAKELILKMNTLQTFDTLFYRDKGGRIFKAKSWAEAESSTVFKAVVEVDAAAGGFTQPIARAKTKTEILEKMVDIAEERIGNKKLRAAIVHGDVVEQANELKAMLGSRFQNAEIYINKALAVTAVHAGKGFISFGFYGRG
jgi:DegV family protein with EDD domain